MNVPAVQSRDGTGVGAGIGIVVGGGVRSVPPSHVQHMSAAVKSSSSYQVVQLEYGEGAYVGEEQV